MQISHDDALSIQGCPCCPKQSADSKHIKVDQVWYIKQNHFLSSWSIVNEPQVGHMQYIKQTRFFFVSGQQQFAANAAAT